MTSSTTSTTTSTTAAPLTSPGRLVPDEVMVPRTRVIPGLNTRQQELDWITAAFRGVDLNREDEGTIKEFLRQYTQDTPTGHWAILVERARAAERAATIAELGNDGATAELLEAARAEGYAAGRGDADREHAAADQQRQRAEQAERQRVAGAWATVLGALGGDTATTRG